jgi:hypothetical protein
VRKAVGDAVPGKHRGAFYFWLSRHASPEQVDQFGRIMRAHADGYQDDCLEIADKVTETPPTQNDDQPGCFNSSLSERVALAKMQIETRMKIMAQNEPKKYGAKITTEHTGKDGGPIQTQDLTLTPQEAKALSQALDDEC